MGGCAASKLDNEDTVRHCKDRCRLMKGAVYARHKLAAAHADYCRSLRVTGSALVSFSQGEPFSVSDQTPAVFLRTPSSASAKTPPPPPPVRIPSPSPSIRTPHAPPPPAAAQQQQHFARSPAPSVARSISSQRHQPRRQNPAMKLPHILSDSSYPATPTPSNFLQNSYAGGGGGGFSPSQASSVWNWENFKPPPPPPSEYFDQLHENRDSPDGKSSSLKQYDFFDHESVLNDENASVHSSYSHHSNQGYSRDRDQNFQNHRFHSKNLRKLHDHHQDPILQEPNHLRHRSESGREERNYPRENFHNQDQNSQSNRFHPKNLRKLHDQYQDPILQEPNHPQHRSESRREELKYPRENFHNRPEILQNNRFHPQNLRKLHDQDPILQKPNHLQHRSESGRDERKYPKRNFHSQDEIPPNHLQENSGSESDSEMEEEEEEEEELHQDPMVQNHHRRHQRGDFHNQNHGRRPHPHHQSGDWESEREGEEELHYYSERDFQNQHPISRNNHRHPGTRDADSEAEREELQCSEYEDHDHYSTSSSGSTDLGEEEDLRSETGSAHSKNWPGSANVRSNSRHHHYQHYSPSSSSVHKQGREGMGSDENRMVVRHEDLSEIAEAVKSYFHEAAQSGDRVCDMLEAGPEQLDKQLKKTVYHSSGMMSRLSSLWSSKPPLAIKYKLEPPKLSLNDSSSATCKSLCSTLDSLLAWEKKLYREVKAREGAKMEHERKLGTLQSLEYRGGDAGKVDKTKAAINRLQSLIVVTSQAVTATSSSIVGLRDAHLVPHLVDLCHGFKYMWESMNRVHEAQNGIVLQVRGLVNRAARQPTSDPHRQSTRDLESAVSAWHSAFSRVLKFQRDFVRSLHGWFKLSLLPVDAGPPEAPVAADPTTAFVFCDEWKLALDRVPDTVASEALKSFTNIIHSISAKQAEEAKIKKRADSVAKELDKKRANIRNLEKKFYSSSSSLSAGPPDHSPGSADGTGPALDARDPLAEKKAEVQAWERRVEDEEAKHLRAIEVTRAMTLNNIQTGLPPVFQAMTNFSASFIEALEVVCKRSYSIDKV